MLLTRRSGIPAADAAQPGSRVWSVIQFTSQVAPPSTENDCSKWGAAQPPVSRWVKCSARRIEKATIENVGFSIPGDAQTDEPAT